MKFLNKITDSSMVNEATDKKFVSDAEKTAITHSNRGILDKLSEIGGELAYDGEALSAVMITLGTSQPTVGWWFKEI